jgi:hypothetical protein
MQPLPLSRIRLVALLAFASGGGVFAQSADTCEAQRLVSPPEAPTSSFGQRVASNGEYWFVSESQARTLCGGSAFECATGAVFVYDEFDGRLELVQTLVPPDVDLHDFFGTGMAVEDDRLIVGSMGAEWPGVGFRQGVAYIYELEDGIWREADRLEPPVEVTEHFGARSYLSGDVALVTSSRPANVYRYERLDSGWTLRGTVEPPDPLTRDDCFACAGVAEGDWIFLSAYFDDSVSHEGGSVYAYRKLADNTLEFVQKIEEVGTRRFGHGVDFDGQTLVVGAYLSERDFLFQGVAYTYRFDGERWILEQEFTHAEPEELDQFGGTVAVRGDQMLVAAFGDSSPPSVAGRVYHFERNTDGQWQETGTLEINPPAIARSYGTAMAFTGDRALIGAMREVDTSFQTIGAAYFFDLACNPCRPDLDLDGALTIFDLLTFLNLFQDGDLLADFDGDGELTIFDFLAFQTAFDAGCE